MEPAVRAAGGLVVRGGNVLLVHRPAYGDWSFPKGKLEAGESWEAGALREVEEETGLECELGPEVGRTRYDVEQGPKEVRYYRMTPRGEARARNEVDELRWATPDEARRLLSYERDRDLLDAVGAPAPAGGQRNRLR
jgi:8-oxo-dGTP diphosphatase